MSDNNIFNNLKDFVIKQSYVDDEVIIEDTKIEDDLGVSGDDAVEFIIAYGKEFNVDVSNFRVSDYFSPEIDAIMLGLIRIFTCKPNPSRKILTVGHLLKGIIAGRLDEEVINSL